MGGYTEQSLPFAGRSPRARQCSYDAAVSAAETRQAKTQMYLTWLRDIGSATDWSAVDRFGWPMSTVTSVRNGLVDRGLVTAVDTCIGRYGKRVTIWCAVTTR